MIFSIGDWFQDDTFKFLTISWTSKILAILSNIIVQTRWYLIKILIFFIISWRKWITALNYTCSVKSFVKANSLHVYLFMFNSHIMEKLQYFLYFCSKGRIWEFITNSSHSEVLSWEYHFCFLKSLSLLLFEISKKCTHLPKEKTGVLLSGFTESDAEKKEIQVITKLLSSVFCP